MVGRITKKKTFEVQEK